MGRFLTVVAVMVFGVSTLAKADPDPAGTADAPPVVVPVVVPTIKLTALKASPRLTVSQATRQGRDLQTAIRSKCTACDGTGEIDIKQAVGRRKLGRNMGQPILKAKTRPCTVCDSGYVAKPAPAQQNMADVFVKALAGLEAMNEKNEAAYKVVFNELIAALTDDTSYKGFIRDGAAKNVTGKFPKTNIAVIGSGSPAVHDKDDGRDRVLFALDDKTYLVVYPQADKLFCEDPTVYYAGVVSDIVERDGKRFVFAQNGLILPTSALVK